MTAGNDEQEDNDGEGTGYAVGKGRPPIGSRFKPGQSGNPKGRPPSRANARREEMPYDYVLGRLVTIREDGTLRQVQADEALLRVLARKGVDRATTIGRITLRALERLRRLDVVVEDGPPQGFIVKIQCEQGAVDRAIRHLGIATLIDPYRKTARLKLDPWIVEAAVHRMGEKRLTREQQERVRAVTRNLRKVRWPTWWIATGGDLDGDDLKLAST